MKHNLSEIQVKEFITWNEGYEQILGKLIVRLQENEVSIKDKELDGFTNAEVRFFMKILEDKHHLNVENIYHILNNLSLIK